MDLIFIRCNSKKNVPVSKFFNASVCTLIPADLFTSLYYNPNILSQYKGEQVS